MYLGFRIEGIGFPEKLRTIARHQSLEKSAKLVDACCRNATKFDLDTWQDHALETLRDIMCYCCLCQPDYLDALRVDSLLRISELHRECLLDLTPSTMAYTRLCALVQAFVMTTPPPLPQWAVNPRRSRRTRNEAS